MDDFIKLTETDAEEAARIAQSTDPALRPLAQMRVINTRAMPGQLIAPALAEDQLVVALDRLRPGTRALGETAKHNGTWTARVVHSRVPGLAVGRKVFLTDAEVRRSALVHIQPEQIPALARP